MTEEGGRGGVADYVQGLAPALARLGQPVELVTASDHLFPPTRGVTILPFFHYLRGSSPGRRLLRRVGLGRVLNGLRFLFTYARCVPLARRCRLVHMHGSEWPPLQILAMCMFRAVGAAVIHSLQTTFDRDAPRMRALPVFEALATRTIVHTRADLSGLSRPERAVVIPFGEYGDVARSGGRFDRESARRHLNLDPDAPVTLLFGQLRADKGIRDVLLAAREVPALRVVIAGEDAGGLHAASDLLNELGGRIIVLEGFQPMDEVAKLFAAADTVVLPYRQASQSAVLLLAYGFERPVIVYPTGGLPEAVTDGETGWICTGPDPGALTAGLREAIDAGPAECRRRGENGARLAKERYSWDGIARRTVELYDEVT